MGLKNVLSVSANGRVRMTEEERVDAVWLFSAEDNS
jgi:hypothetical protein